MGRVLRFGEFALLSLINRWLIFFDSRFCRAVGSLCGIVLCNAVMWWYWPEAHGFVVSPLGVALWGTAVVCDLVYPFVLWRVRKTEMVAPDGRIIRTTDKTPANGSGRKRQ